MLRSVSAATFSVSDFDASYAMLASVYNYGLCSEGVVTEALAEFWNAPKVAGARFAVLAPASGENVCIRLVEQPATPGYEPLKTFGWNAAELHVRDVHKLAGTLAETPLTILGGPRDLLGNGAAVALQVLGPSGEVFYLTEINGNNMQRTYGKAESTVGRLFIAVLGASNHGASRNFYAPLTKGTPRPRRFAIRVLAAAHGLNPHGTRFTVGSAVLEEQFRIEIDGYPESAITRPQSKGYLPPGLCLVSFNTAALSLSPYEPERCTDGLREAPYFGRPVQILYGPDGEWLELIEGT